ncbi:hypothetical protein IF650_17540 [Cellulosimicrobium terreum]|nr:hypothetical protein [Cellulosimicrobium terreum]
MVHGGGVDPIGTVRRTIGRDELDVLLSLVLDHVDPDAEGVPWRLVGTASALAQGVALPVGDVDVLVASRGDVDQAAAALSGYPCSEPPRWLPDAQQYFVRFVIGQVEVEISTVEQAVDTDTSECAGRGPWEHHVPVGFGRHVLSVVGLELRLVSEIVRERPDRYVPLLEHLRSCRADLPLVHRAMRDRGVDPAVRDRVMDRLRDVPGGMLTRAPR